MNVSRRASLTVPSSRPRAASLQRQTSLVEPAASIVGLPEIERAPSKVSRHAPIEERRESQCSEDDNKDDEKGEETYVADEVTFPDGGLRAWLCVVGAFWTVFCGFGLAGTMGAFQTLYRSSFLQEYSESQISWIISIQAFFTFGLACFTGSLFDSYGHKPLIAGGTLSLVLGFCMLSLCTEYYQFFLVHATLIAWGSNLLFICPMGVVGQWFYHRRGLAFGVMSTGSSVGSVVWPILLANLPDKVGFGWTCRIMALICLFCGIISYLLLATRLPRKPRGAFFYRPAWRNPQYVLAVVNFWTASFSFFVFQSFIGTYGQLAGLGTFAPYLLVIQNGSSISGRLVAGYLADVIGIYNVTLVSSAIMTIMAFVWIACDTLVSCIILVIIMGIAGGAFVSLQAPLATKTATDMRFGGTMVGQALFVQSFSQLICGPIFGALIGTGSEADRFARFPHAIILGGLMSTIATAALTTARYKAVGWRIKVKT